jgi:hypothetical protein
MPYQVNGSLVHAMSGNELSRVRTEVRLRPPSLSTNAYSSREPTLLCNQVVFGQIFTCAVSVYQALDPVGRDPVRLTSF